MAAPYLQAATDSRRVFLDLHELLLHRTRSLRASGFDVGMTYERTVDEHFRRTRVGFVLDGVTALELLYRCDGGLRPLDDPDSPHMQIPSGGQRYYAQAGASPRVRSTRPDGSGSRFSNNQMAGGLLARLARRADG